MTERFKFWLRHVLGYEVKRRWEQRYVWRLIRLVPRELKYWIVVQAAVTGERGNPGNVTALTLMERIKPNDRA
jgi:hypothetical protein